ncbi:ABC transporter permease [Paraburkholderia sp. MM6662-R1]|uniref:ABC transporter permease n=1 Tax=Paraburkholderia sp. MM6662-R1 TaxID=2991066 RepID=UPI003D1DEDC3
MKSWRTKALLLLPALLIFGLFLVLPMLAVLNESFQTFTPGRVGAVANAPRTLVNYTEIFKSVYAIFFLKTYWLSFVASILATIFAFPASYYVARHPSQTWRKTLISGIVGLMFLSAIVRVYSIQLTFGNTGVVAPVLRALGINMNSGFYLDCVVIAGLLHYAIPMSMLILIGGIQKLNPRLHEAAESLGASTFGAHLTITLPMCARSIISAFIVSVTLGISAFVIPWILGKGKVLFVSNLVYSRFSEVADYPSGAAISVVMMILSFALIFLLSRVAGKLDPTGTR